MTSDGREGILWLSCGILSALSFPHLSLSLPPPQPPSLVCCVDCVLRFKARFAFSNGRASVVFDDDFGEKVCFYIIFEWKKIVGGCGLQKEGRGSRGKGVHREKYCCCRTTAIFLSFIYSRSRMPKQEHARHRRMKNSAITHLCLKKE